MTTKYKWIARLGAIAVALSASLAAQPLAHAATSTTVPYICKTRLSGEWLDVTGYSRGLDVTAPATVSAGASFDVVIDPQPIYPVPTFNKELRLVSWAFTLPANARLVSKELTGGSALNNSQVSSAVVSNTLVVSVSGPLPGGVEFDVPSIKLTFKAPQTGTVSVKPGGTSYNNPGFGWTRLHPDTKQWDPFICYPDPNAPVTLSSTTVA